MDDLLLRGGIIAGRQQDMAIQAGRIRRVAAELATEAHELIDIRGKLVLPGFVESPHPSG